MNTRRAIFERMRVVSAALLSAAGFAIAKDGKPPLKPAEFARALSHPVVAQVDEAELRPFLLGLAGERNIPLLFDRRIDPGQSISWKVEGEPFQQALERRAGQFGATSRVIGQTVFLGPEQATRKLRTLVALRREELRQLTRWPASKRIDAQARRDVHWEDASDPRQLLQRISDRWKLPVTNPEDIPEDLWAEGSLQQVDAAEAFSVLLIQFDRSFAWRESPPGLTIVPIPESVTIERRYTPPRNRQQTLLEQLAAVAPDAECSLRGSELTVRGSAEDHDAVAALLAPNRSGKPRPEDTVPLKDRRFTLTARQVTILDALQALEAQGITVNYDINAFADANIQLDHRIDLKLQKATIDELLRPICEPVGLKYAIDGLTITLTPDLP